LQIYKSNISSRTNTEAEEALVRSLTADFAKLKTAKVNLGDVTITYQSKGRPGGVDLSVANLFFLYNMLTHEGGNSTYSLTPFMSEFMLGEFQSEAKTLTGNYFEFVASLDNDVQATVLKKSNDKDRETVI